MKNKTPILTPNEKIIKAHADELWAKAFTAIEFTYFVSLSRFEQCQYNIAMLLCNEILEKSIENKQQYILYDAVKEYLTKTKNQ